MCFCIYILKHRFSYSNENLTDKQCVCRLNCLKIVQKRLPKESIKLRVSDMNWLQTEKKPYKTLAHLKRLTLNSGYFNVILKVNST